VVKEKGKTSNRIEAENVLDTMAEWSFSLNNLQQNQPSINAPVF